MAYCNICQQTVTTKCGNCHCVDDCQVAPATPFMDAAEQWMDNAPTWLRSSRDYWESRAKRLETELRLVEKNNKALQSTINKKHQQVLDARVERNDALLELRLAHEDNRCLQKAIDALQSRCEKLGDDFNMHYRQRW